MIAKVRTANFKRRFRPHRYQKRSLRWVMPNARREGGLTSGPLRPQSSGFFYPVYILLPVSKWVRFFISCFELVILRCSTCGALASSLRFSRHLPSRRAPAPSNPRLKSPVGIFSPVRWSFLLAHPSRSWVRCFRPQRRVQPVLLRSSRRFCQRVPRGVGAGDAARYRCRRPSPVGPDFI